MRDNEYPAYLEYFISDFAVEIASNYGLSESVSIAQAKQEVAADLPDGVHTSGQILLCVVDQTDSSERLIGYLWYKPNATMRSAFICDFHILAPYQGKGLGKQALEVLERELKGQGFEHIKLRVAEDNDRARHVYEATGFRVTGVNMNKAIASK
jgi:ribosomal protein S18 acetylase RimI-like enzyme